jgi:hypothetical protein
MSDPVLPTPAGPYTIVIGHHELILRRRYEALGTVNDILIGLWFIVGSVLFLFGATTYAGTWLFILGSIELLVRPLIRVSRYWHLRRLPAPSGAPSDADTDF